MSLSKVTPALVTFFSVAAFLLVMNFAITPTKTTNGNESTNGNANVASTNTDRTLVTNVNIATNTNTAVDAAKDWKTYSNVENKYSIKYPPNWRVTEEFGIDAVQILPPSVNEGNLGPNGLKGAITMTNKEAGDEIQNPQPVTVNGYEAVQGTVLGIVTFKVTEFDRGTVKIRARWSQKFTDVIYSQVLSTITFTDPTAGWKTFTNESWDISFKYPADWEIRSNTLTSTINQPGGALILSPDTNSKPGNAIPQMFITANEFGRGGPQAQRVYTLERQVDGSVKITKETETCESFGENICGSNNTFFITAGVITNDERDLILYFPTNSHAIPDPDWTSTVKNIIASMSL